MYTSYFWVACRAVIQICMIEIIANPLPNNFCFFFFFSLLSVLIIIVLYILLIFFSGFGRCSRSFFSYFWYCLVNDQNCAVVTLISFLFLLFPARHFLKKILNATFFYHIYNILVFDGLDSSIRMMLSSSI